MKVTTCADIRPADRTNPVDIINKDISKTFVIGRSFISLLELQVDNGGFLGAEYAQSFPAAADAVPLGLELIFNVGAEAGKMIAAVVLRDERADLQRLGVLQLHHRLGYRLI